MSTFTYRNASDDDARSLQDLAIRALKLDLGAVNRSGVTANMAGLQSDRYQLSQRTDSRTIFLQDTEFRAHDGAGVFDGPDDELIDRAMQILNDLGVDSSEVSERNVATEQVEAASIDRKTGVITSAGIRDGKRYAVLSRTVDGMPIWRSGVTLGLTRDGYPGYLQLHWPEIPGDILESARGYRAAESSDWSPPSIEYAEPESMQAGILHSPAVSLVMDHVAAIRVVYRPLTADVGKKPVLYLDFDGQPVGLPRHFEETPGPIEGFRSVANAA
jgi:hypothetical protein